MYSKVLKNINYQFLYSNIMWLSINCGLIYLLFSYYKIYYTTLRLLIYLIVLIINSDISIIKN